ncbi:mannonate dehydratase [Aegicerativicinus sediminis]|uniref:mannonate dehydratase n=1 Tax=Aegicerativicinus sediminis TaxID=2893202 RepID=UPI001E3D326B|nr:mannonate dehydratase [Aegicerativicinus sediminis]
MSKTNATGVFEQSWRWYGPHDPVSLEMIKQSGASGIVTALHHIPVGEIWTVDEIKKRIALLEDSNQKLHFPLHWNVVESLPVHEHIKQGREDKVLYIENYKKSLKNLAECGVKTVCYNFMPVLDWLRTNVRYKLSDGSVALCYNLIDLIIFDLFILERDKAEKDYPSDKVDAAKQRYKEISKEELDSIKSSLLMALPGDQHSFTLDKLKQGLSDYSNISRHRLRENLISFLKEVVPYAESLGVNMAIHPDDPPWSVLGLPRVVSSMEDLQYLFNSVPSKSNGLTFCSGSLGASKSNNLVDIIEAFYPRIHFVHLRSVQHFTDSIFFEAKHLEGDADMFSLVKTFHDYQQKSKRLPLPMRPDHGHELFDDQNKPFYPGYSAIGRLKGLAELRGLEMGIVKMANL